MGEQLSEANRDLIERVLGEMVGTTSVREAINSFPNMFGRIFDAIRSEGPHPEQNAENAHCSNPGESGEWVMVPREMTPDIKGALELAFLKCKGLASHLAAPKLYAEVLRVSPPPLEGAGADPVTWPNDKPPPHWTPDDKYDRHPKTVEAWDWRQDPRGDERAAVQIRRLNFAADFADPRAPDQMALVLRGDLIDVKHRLIRSEALCDLYKSQLDIAKAAAPPASSKGEALPVAWTGSGSLRALELGGEGFIWPEKGKAHPIPLYARPVPGVSREEVLEEAAKRVEAQIPPAAGGPHSHTNTARVVLIDAVKSIRALLSRGEG